MRLANARRRDCNPSECAVVKATVFIAQQDSTMANRFIRSNAPLSPGLNSRNVCDQVTAGGEGLGARGTASLSRFPSPRPSPPPIMSSPAISSLQAGERGSLSSRAVAHCLGMRRFALLAALLLSAASFPVGQAVADEPYSLRQYLSIRGALTPMISPSGKDVGFLTDITGVTQLWCD